MIYERYVYANNDCGGSIHEFKKNVLFKLEALYTNSKINNTSLFSLPTLPYWQC